MVVRLLAATENARGATIGPTGDGYSSEIRLMTLMCLVVVAWVLEEGIMTDIREVSLMVALVKERLNAILAAIDDERLDCEQTMEEITKQTKEAMDFVEHIRVKIEAAGG
jgi:hypothetical protein